MGNAEFTVLGCPSGVCARVDLCLAIEQLQCGYSNLECVQSVKYTLITRTLCGKKKEKEKEKEEEKMPHKSFFYLLHVEMTILWIYWANQNTVLKLVSCIFAFLNMVIRKFKMIYVSHTVFLLTIQI